MAEIIKGTRDVGAAARRVARVWRAAFAKLSLRRQRRNPVVLMVFLCAVLTLVLFALSLFVDPGAWPGFILAVSVVLWLTVVLSKFVEALVERRRTAQKAAARSTIGYVGVHKLNEGLVARGSRLDDPATFFHLRAEEVDVSDLKKKDLFFVAAGDQIPTDGEIVRGAASVDESAITGESAPVVRESGGDRSTVTGGTTVLSDWLVVRVTADEDHGFLERMLALADSTSRKDAGGGAAYTVLLAVFVAMVLAAVASPLLSGGFWESVFGEGAPSALATLVALLVCLVPTTVGALAPMSGVAGMCRLSQANVLAIDGRAVEAAGKVDVLLLDKTGTVTLGNRQATDLIPVGGATERELADAALLASVADETPEGRSIVALAREVVGEGDREPSLSADMVPVPFTAQTLMSGVDCGACRIRKGAPDAVRAYVESGGGVYDDACAAAVERITRAGGTPLLVSRDRRILGVVHLHDVVKQGIRESLAGLRAMGIKTVMVTGDNPFAAAAVAAEAGIDDFIAGATPEKKLEVIRRYQSKGHTVAMAGDGVNDAPALAQADVAVAMGSGAQAAKEAGNMIDLDSSPTKLIEIVRIGKRLLATRRNLTAFSVANDVVIFLIIISALLAPLYPQVEMLNVLHLSSMRLAILSALVYDAMILVALTPLALVGTGRRRPSSRGSSRWGVVACGLGGAVLPFAAIKLIDVLMTLMVGA